MENVNILLNAQQKGKLNAFGTGKNNPFEIITGISVHLSENQYEYLTDLTIYTSLPIYKSTAN